MLKMTDLLRRGWSRTNIRKYLPSPDAVGRGASGRLINLYSLSRVEALEKAQATRRK